jgi:hypothetical protein
MFKTAKEKDSKDFRVDPYKHVVYEQEPEESEVEEVSEDDFSNKSLSDKLNVVFDMLKELQRTSDERHRQILGMLEDLSLIAGREHAGS